MRVNEYLTLSRKLYKSTSTIHIRYLLKDKNLSVDDKYDIIRKEYVLRYGRVLSKSREYCMKEMIRGPRQSHDDLFHVHCNDEDTNMTLCGIWGFNVTEELEDVTCPDCQIIILNHYVVVE